MSTMKKLTKKQAEECFYNALCNGLDELMASGIRISATDPNEYAKAKASLVAKKPKDGVCLEDVYMEMLRLGYTLSSLDIDGDEDYNVSITLKDVHDRIMLTPERHLQDMLGEVDDAITADVILQTIFFKEVVFG